VISDRGRWVEAETEAGQRGYLPAESMERDADRDARRHRAKTLLSFAPVFGVVGEDTDIALAPYPLAAHGGRLRKGSVIAIHSVDHTYFAFEDKRWGIAFVSSAHVDLVPPDPRQPAISPEKIRPLKDLTVIDLQDTPPPEEPMAETLEPRRETFSVPIAEEPAAGSIEPPVVLERVEPSYPELARRAGLEGVVELEISIDTTGRVTDVEVVRGLPLGLSEAAADAVRRWSFRPARTRAGPVASRRMIRMRFMLQESP
jgi:protein TonB